MLRLLLIAAVLFLAARLVLRLMNPPKKNLHVRGKPLDQKRKISQDQIEEATFKDIPE